MFVLQNRPDNFAAIEYYVDTQAINNESENTGQVKEGNTSKYSLYY